MSIWIAIVNKSSNFNPLVECEGLELGIIQENRNQFSTFIENQFQNEAWYSEPYISKNLVSFNSENLRKYALEDVINTLLTGLREINNKQSLDLVLYDYTVGYVIDPSKYDKLENDKDWNNWTMEETNVWESVMSFDEPNDQTQEWDFPKKPWWKIF